MKQVQLYDLLMREGEGDPYKGLTVGRDWTKVRSRVRLSLGHMLYVI